MTNAQSSTLPVGVIVLAVALLCSSWSTDTYSCPVSSVYEPQGPYDPDPDELFQEGRRLLLLKRYAKACLKLAESHRIEPSGGTALHLALCHKGEGKILQAWLKLHEGLLLARCSEREDQAKWAQEALEDIEAAFPRLILDVAQGPSRVRGLEVIIDGQSIKSNYWKSGIPIEQGEHTITILAPGRRTRQVKVRINESTTTLKIALSAVASKHVLPRRAARPH